MKRSTDWASEVELAWDTGDFKRALSILRFHAEAGESSAMSNLGVIYECGLAGRKNVARAKYWYKRAWAGSADTAAASNLADLYWKRGEVGRAYYWINKLVARADAEAMTTKAQWLVSRSRSRSARREAYRLAMRATRSAPMVGISQDTRNLALKFAAELRTELKSRS